MKIHFTGDGRQSFDRIRRLWGALLKNCHVVSKSKQYGYSNGKDGEKGPEWYDESFENDARWTSHYSKSPYYSLWTVISDRIRNPSVKTILDVGCGSGQLASLLSDKGVTNYCGIDFSPKRIAQARKVCPAFRFEVVDAFKTKLLDDYPYDTVVSTEFLEHVEKDTVIIERIRKGAHFIGTVPSFAFTSHVRHFGSCGEVSERYSKYFNDFRVDSFSANDKGKTFFILEGIKSG